MAGGACYDRWMALTKEVKFDKGNHIEMMLRRIERFGQMSKKSGLQYADRFQDLLNALKALEYPDATQVVVVMAFKRADDEGRQGSDSSHLETRRMRPKRSYRTMTKVVNVAKDRGEGGDKGKKTNTGGNARKVAEEDTDEEEMEDLPVGFAQSAL
ncbi:hypothetical protein HDU67_010194 [Dinochytrium kinnereticum]|nr:hypothetical protein HDU67_010194 [Dinochytrium kinnereticum]